ncbi:MAG: FecR family protein [Spirochaetaceae bacterium]|nr:FecR family protein [Spirochaetaceae bacterium]
MKTVLVCMLVLAGTWGAFAQSGPARFIEVRGTVEIQDAGSAEWRAASPGDFIGKNTVVSTGFKSSALISLGDSRLSVRPLTRLTLEELIQRDSTEEINVYLRTGRIRAEVRPPPGMHSDFTVRAPMATASVRGTDFEFDTTHLYVDSGLVLMEGAGGQTVYVDAGQRSYVDESSQRVMPPFEAEAALLSPVLSELANTGSDTGSYGPEITAPGDVSALGIETEWP